MCSTKLNEMFGILLTKLNIFCCYFPGKVKTNKSPTRQYILRTFETIKNGKPYV